MTQFRVFVPAAWAALKPNIATRYAERAAEPGALTPQFDATASRLRAIAREAVAGFASSRMERSR